MNRSRGQSDQLRAMSSAECGVVLDALGLAHEPPGEGYLRRLMWAWLKWSSFHNLELLAGCSPRDPEGCIRAVLDGRGGLCHVQALAFLALLRGLGFSAHLAAATIGQPSDHLVPVVRLGNRSFACDVGNGHPYTLPFDGAGTTEINHLGWVFVARGDGRTMSLERRLNDGDWKSVYQLDLTPRPFRHFRGAIDSHHLQPGFGPFLTGLRAVLIRDDLLVTLRDQTLRRYSPLGVVERLAPLRDQQANVLTRTFGFPADLVARALASYCGGSSIAIPSPNPRVTVLLSTTDRPGCLAALLDDIEEEVQQSRNCKGVEVLAVENGVCPRGRARNRETIRRSGLSIHLVDDGVYGRPIAGSRERQVAALLERIHDRADPRAVWMVDDDIRLRQLTLRDSVLSLSSEVRYFDEIVAAYRRHPEASVLVGGVTGDPPIRPVAVLATQLFDIVANLTRFQTMVPGDVYHTPSQRLAFAQPDFYYDHSTSGAAHLLTPFLWLPRQVCGTVAGEALEFLNAAPGLLAGKTPCRPLVATHEAHGAETSAVLRGGSAVFLDVDALLRYPYPSVVLDGVATRRSDMVGASFLAAEGGTWLGTFAFPVLHARSLRPAPSPEAVLASLKSEHYGVMLARLVMGQVGGSGLEQLATTRATTIVERLAKATETSQTALEAVSMAHDSWMGRSAEHRDALTRLRGALEQARLLYLGGASPTGQAAWRASIFAALTNRDILGQVQGAFEGLDASVARARRQLVSQEVEDECA